MAPNNSTPSLMELEAKHSAGTYPKRDLVLVRGSGVHVWDADGRQYVDCVGGHGVCLLGHCHPNVTKAVCDQAAQMVTCPGIFYNDRRAELLSKLAELTGLRRAFLCNSGTEAIEGAFKFARLSTGRTGILATMRGFHGRTMGALSATWNKNYRAPFEPLVPGISHVPYENVAKLEAAIGEDTAALVLEVVQGEGGVRPGSADYLQAAQKLCQERGALLIVDEVQTGFGRTGRMFAYQHASVQPDILCLAKGIAGGVPMGAIMLGERVGGIKMGMHGSTFGGNPLACAAALASINVLQTQDLPAQAAEKGAYLQARLHEIEAPVIREIRGRGLMVGIELRTRARPYLEALIGKGVLALPAGSTVIRLLPPLIIRKEELDIVVSAIADVLQQD
jgi:acetylornithine/LysW-gamma-L-lysine aminotransferase